MCFTILMADHIISSVRILSEVNVAHSSNLMIIYVLLYIIALYLSFYSSIINVIDRFSDEIDHLAKKIFAPFNRNYKFVQDH